MKHIAVILTVFSRAELTKRALNALLKAEQRRTDVKFQIFVVDDGSTDHTHQMLRSEFGSTVTTIPSPGGLFWARGMHLAYTVAIQQEWEELFWINDDVDFDPDWLDRLLPRLVDADIVVGAMRGSTGELSYGGLRRIGRGPAALRLVAPGAQGRKIDTFQGNLVAMRREVAARLGGPDPVWAHGYGDIDFGYRAAAAGFTAVLAPGFFGTCDTNPIAGTWMDAAAPVRLRLSSLFGRKGQPPRDHWRFMRRHGGLLAPLWFIASYANKLVVILLRRPQKKTDAPCA